MVISTYYTFTEIKLENLWVDAYLKQNINIYIYYRYGNSLNVLFGRILSKT